MSIALTIFRSIFDNETSKVELYDSWEQFENTLFELAKRPGYKPKKGEKPTSKCSPLISPAIYKAGETRSNKSVVEWAGFACLDIDDYGDKTPDQVLQAYKDYYFICYSTASSTKEKPRFRVILRLDRSAKADEIRHLWYGLNKKFLGVVDTQTKDPSRMFYIPATYPNAYNFIFKHEGKPLSVNEVKAEHPHVEKNNTFLDNLPEEARNAILEFRKSKLQNTKITWTSYRDCPFVSKKLLRDYMCCTSGWYNMSYKLLCSIACNAVKSNYPITAREVASIFREIDNSSGAWYKERPLEVEAERAVDYAMKNL